jgi:HK97 family phage portal protein
MPQSLIGKILALSGNRQVPGAPRYGGRSQSGYTAGSRMTQLSTMSTMGTLYAIVQLISTGVSGPEWSMYRKPVDGRVRYAPSDGGSDMRQEVLQHAALNVWNHPNDFFTGTDFREVGWQFRELVGEWYWVLDRVDLGGGNFGPPVAIWPVRPDRMEPVPDPDTIIRGWTYTGPNGELVPLDRQEVIQLRYPDPQDFCRGLSPVQSILADIDSARYTAEWSRNFFLNSATPGGIVQFSKRLSDEEFDEFTARWREQHQGVARGHRVGILEQGALWIPNTYSMRDMQFIELRHMNREVVREAYRIHGTMLGLAEDINRANAQTAEEVHTAWHEVPRLRRTRAALNEKFLPMYGETGGRVEFDFEDPTPADREQDNAELAVKATAAATLVTAGYDPTDVLRVVGLPAMKTIPVPEPAPRPAIGGGAPDQNQPSDQEAKAAARAIRLALRPRPIDREAERVAELLLSELPHRTNGHQRLEIL